jgi:hypothetical protein
VKDFVKDLLHRLDRWTLTAFNPIFASYAATKRR